MLKHFAMTSALLAGALMLMAQGANAQPADQTEEVHVTAPHFLQSEPNRLNGTLEKLSLSDVVYYNDLDLRTRAGAQALRLRVRDKAAEICEQIAQAYPVREAPGTSCFKDAYQTGMLHAGEAISDARYGRHYAYDVDYEY